MLLPRVAAYPDKTNSRYDRTTNELAGDRIRYFDAQPTIPAELVHPSARTVPVKTVPIYSANIMCAHVTLSCRKSLRGTAPTEAKNKPGDHVRNAYSIVPSLNSEKLT